MRETRFGGIVDDWDDYLRLFAGATRESAIGEASVCYLWSPSAAQRIAQKRPDAKILILLRDPADRAFSQYLHGVANGVIRWSFHEHIERSLRRRSHEISVFYPFLEFGMYTEQLLRYRGCFGSNVWIGLFDDLKKEPAEVFASICRFLGVAPDFSPEMRERKMAAQVPRSALAGRLRRSGIWQAAAKSTPARLRPFLRRGLMRGTEGIRMEPADRAFLVDYYREDIRRLAELLDRDLSPWLLTSAENSASKRTFGTPDSSKSSGRF